jgi:multidrug resistance efflux pump
VLTAERDLANARYTLIASKAQLLIPTQRRGDSCGRRGTTEMIPGRICFPHVEVAQSRCFALAGCNPANEVCSACGQVDADDAGVASAQSEVSKAQNDFGQYGDINARRKAAEATLYEAKLNLGYCSCAPFDAYVTNLNIRVGHYANEGARGSKSGRQSNLVRAGEFPRELPRLDPARHGRRVYLLSYPNRRFRGRVQGVGWALFQKNGATVQGLPKVEETLNWVRLSQRFLSQ